MLWRTIVLALRAIRRNLMRSLLTCLGVVIGVGAVIAVFTLGAGSSQKITDEVASLGQNMLTVRPGRQMGRGGIGIRATRFKIRDVEAISKQVSGIAAIAPVSQRSVRLVYGSQNHSTSVSGTTSDFFIVRNWNLAEGREFSEAEDKSGGAVCIIGKTVQTELFGNADPLDRQIRVDRITCTVIGVLEELGSSSFGSDQDDFIAIPLRTFQQRFSGTDDIDSIILSAADGDNTALVKSDIESLLRQRRKIDNPDDDDFRVTDMKEINERITSVTGAMTLLLAAIAGVSLVVGGIGIMNIMLVSVTERTREIGIRMAIGARARDVMLQFLVEAVMLSTLGGLLGVIVGLGGAYIATLAMQVPFVISPFIIAVAFVFSTAVGIVFGFFPSRKAANLNPIDCLRYE